MTAQPILSPYDLDRLRSGSGTGPDALITHGVLNGVDGATPITIEVEASPASQIQHCIAIDAAIASAVRGCRAAGQRPIVFSGNCHACLGTLAGLGDRAAIVWFDAHGDLNTSHTTATGYFDGMALATALGWDWAELTRQIPGFTAANDTDAILIGGRDLDDSERALLNQSRVAHHAPPAGSGHASPELERLLSDPSRPRQAYVHLDLDVIDPPELRANRFEAPGGVSVAWLEDALGLVRKRHDIAAIGVTAYDPSFTAPEVAAPIVNRLLRALLRTTP